MSGRSTRRATTRQSGLSEKPLSRRHQRNFLWRAAIAAACAIGLIKARLPAVAGRGAYERRSRVAASYRGCGKRGNERCGSWRTEVALTRTTQIAYQNFLDPGRSGSPHVAVASSKWIIRSPARSNAAGFRFSAIKQHAGPLARARYRASRFVRLAIARPRPRATPTLAGRV